MILVDTSVWIDHFYRGDDALVAAIDSELVLMHPFVLGELACGSIPNRRQVLADLARLPASVVARHSEARRFIDHHFLMGKGVGYIDVHLLAAAVLEGAKVYTRDKRLLEAALRLGVAYTPA